MSNQFKKFKKKAKEKAEQQPVAQDAPEPSEESLNAAASMNDEIQQALEGLRNAMESFPEGFTECAAHIPSPINGWESKHWHNDTFYAIETWAPKGGKSVKIEPVIEKLQEYHQDNVLSWKRIRDNKHFLIIFNKFVMENVMVDVNGAKVRLIRMPDDVLALRLEAGGNPIVNQWYIKYRGDGNDILDMLEMLVDAFREGLREQGVYKSKLILS